MKVPDKWLNGVEGHYNPEYVKFLEQTLLDIANPLSRLDRAAKETGAQLNPTAFAIANDPETLKRWARDAIVD